MSDAEIAELLSQDPNRESEARCWSALARVVDDDAMSVYGDGGTKNPGSGMTVTCQILTGIFNGEEVAAMVSCPPGSGTEVSPFRAGERLLIHFLDGDLDGLIVVGATVPGGDENPMPTAAAGMDLAKADGSGMKAARVFAPPKGVGVRFYVRGAAFVVRLKGSQDGYAGELYIEADDAKNGDGKNGTFVRLVKDPLSSSFGIKARTAEGAFVNLFQDTVTLASGDNENQLIVDDTGVSVFAKAFKVKADSVKLDGMILVNWALPTPPATGQGGVLYISPAPLSPVPGPLAAILGQSQSVFIGG